MDKNCTACKGEEKKEIEQEESLAMTLLKEYSAQAKKWFTICMVILSMWLATIAGFIWYLYQYDYEVSETAIEQSAPDGGVNNFIGNDGDILNGETKDNRS